MKDTGNSIGANVPERTYTRTRAAYLVNRSVSTIVRWHKEGLYVPSASMQSGKLKVWLYTDDDISALKQIARAQKPGRKPKARSSDAMPRLPLIEDTPLQLPDELER